jgi:segregation and condensation protein B
LAFSRFFIVAVVFVSGIPMRRHLRKRPAALNDRLARQPSPISLGAMLEPSSSGNRAARSRRKRNRQLAAASDVRLDVGGRMRYDAGEILSPIAGADEPHEVLRSRVEAILLLSREPVPARKLAQLAGLADATAARTLAGDLNGLYDRLQRGIRIEEVAGGYQLMTRKAFATWVQRLEHVPEVERLSQMALETLALVAYRQPILRVDVEAIRGVSSGELLRQLIERDLVRIAGRSEELGRPYLYGTTKRFLQVFGLQSLSRLPKADWIEEVDFQSAPTSSAEFVAKGNGDGISSGESSKNVSEEFEVESEDDLDEEDLDDEDVEPEWDEDEDEDDEDD